MDRPLVSVDIITYNHKPYIAQAIEGALQQQTSFPFEIVIGEDCSTDGTREIVFDYQKRYPKAIRVVTSDHNVGALANSSRVHAACSGKYIAYCDGDDWWHHSLKLQKQVDYLEAHPNVGLVHSDHDCHLVEAGATIRDYMRVYERMSPNDVKDVFSGLLLGRYWITSSTVCARMDLMRQTFQQERSIFEDPNLLLADLPCWLNMCRRCEFFFLEESLATYRVLAESASQHRSQMDAFRFHEYSQRIRLLFAERYECPPAVRLAVRTQYYTTLLNGAYHAGDADLARYAFDNLRNVPNRASLWNWLCFLGATHRAGKRLMGPFLQLRRAVLRWRKAYRIRRGKRAFR
jgi:glycosyltransferase involved in cell wall biosynthesis